MTDTIETSKTYKGRTAGGYLKTASVAKSQAGIAEVWIQVAGHPVPVIMTDDGEMVIMSYSQTVAVLEMSSRATAKFEALIAASEEINLQ